MDDRPFTTSQRGRRRSLTKDESRVSGTEAEQTFRDGERIFAEGDEGRQMFIIGQGHVRIAKQRDDAEVTLNVIGRGDFFGEMSLLESLPRFASAYAVGSTRVIVIEPGSLLVRIRRDPTFALEMLNRLSSRLRESNNRLIEAMGATPDFVPTWESTLGEGTIRDAD